MNHVLPQLRSLAKVHPALLPFMPVLLGGGCCRAPSDRRLRERVTYFLTQHPEFKEILSHLTETGQ
jgi:hypothetical protein